VRFLESTLRMRLLVDSWTFENIFVKLSEKKPLVLSSPILPTALYTIACLVPDSW
jgi:hypothetical protein